MRRWLLKALAGFVILLLVLAAIAYGLASRSLPAVDGTITVSGPTAPIEIVRDAGAVPHIFGATRADALFGLGYVHAQDRLWQMEFQRRIGFGRLAEIFGRAALPQDRFLRTVGFGRAAQDAWVSTPQWAKDQIDAYVAGVNAFIATHGGAQLPVEFSLLHIEPEPWTGPDVIVWVKMMAWDLSLNYTFELLRHDLAAAVGPDRAKDLLPPYPAGGLTVLRSDDLELKTQHPGPELRTRNRESGARFSTPGSSATFSGLSSRFREAMRGVPAVDDFLFGSARTEATGSNNWVVDGSMTSSGRPLLANDPHLGTHVPSTWYLAHMSAGDFDVIGATLPGAPAVALGRNKYIAWGATNVGADVQDLYQERIDAATGTAEFRGEADPIRIIPETIAVKGEAPVTINVRITRHGPVVSDAINANMADLPQARQGPPLEPLAFRWTALDADDTTLAAFLRINEAKNWAEFTGALREYYVVPSQNLVYADVEGHIGYYAPGRMPIREGGDGSSPAAGWTGGAEWIGWVPFDELPHVYDPPSHFIVTANNRPAPDGYPHQLGQEWIEPFRAQRITDLLTAKGGSFTPDDFTGMQRDTQSQQADALLPLLMKQVKPADARDREALRILNDWDREARPDSAAAAIFTAWFLELAPGLAGDEVGPLAMESYQERFTFVTRFVANTLGAPDSAWCDNVKTPGRESCQETITAALHTALDKLSERMGSDLARWRWDAVHVAVFPHALDSVGVLRPWLSRSVPNGGDWSTVNASPVASDHPYEQRHVPGYRQIVDLSPANDSRFLSDVGQSGHPLSPHYDDYLPRWRDVRHLPMQMDRAAIERDAIGTLTLTPGSRNGP